MSDAKTQYKEFNKAKTKLNEEFSKEIARIFLRLPLPMSYEVWRKLHEIKGDWIE